MTTKKNTKIYRTTKKTRCPKGSRRDKKSGECVQYTKVKVFKEIADQTISETKATLALESMGDKGTVLKLYDKGDLQHQAFVSNDQFEKSKKASQKDIQKMLKMMHKIQKDPSMMKKDKKFIRLQKKLKKMKGGSDGSPEDITVESKTDILIQEDLMDNIQGNAIEKHEDKIEEIQSKESTSWLDDTWNWMGSNLKAVTTSMHLMDAGMFAWWASGEIGKAALFNAFSVDCAGMITISIMNILRMYYPSKEMDEYNTWTQYIVYTLIAGSTMFLMPHTALFSVRSLASNYTSWFMVPDAVWVAMMAAFGLYTTTAESMEPTEDDKKLENAKMKVVEELENPPQ